MGEAARRRARDAQLVWHHTSILRTNRIWMSGVIELEGQSPGVEHPAFGQVFTSAKARRALVDFPPLVWLTSQINVPRCLQHFEVIGTDRTTGEPKRLEIGPEAAAAFSLNRVALGFPISEAPVMPWPDHFGYSTTEGRDLNDSAREVGDNPDDWWIADKPLDILVATSFRSSPTIMGTKLERHDEYLSDVRRMVMLCREVRGTVIPPTWVGTDAHRALTRTGGDVTGWGGMVR